MKRLIVAERRNKKGISLLLPVVMTAIAEAFQRVMQT